MHFIEEDVLKILITNEEINTRCQELAKEIDNDYKDKNPILVCLLKGALPFLAKLLEHIKIPMEIDCIKVHSYSGTNSTGKVTIEHLKSEKYKNRHVILVEDIIDTGLTLNETCKLFKEFGVESLEIMSLLNKPVLNKVELNAKYIGFEIPNEFVIGFGLDYNEQYRNLPYIGIMNTDKLEK